MYTLMLGCGGLAQAHYFDLMVGLCYKFKSGLISIKE
jgi:hypothetical protein